MPESIERIVRGFSVLRLLSVATLLLILACLVISASIALADAPPASNQLGLSVSDVTTSDIYEFEIEMLPNAEFDELTTL